jgi:hypothetical protein
MAKWNKLYVLRAKFGKKKRYDYAYVSSKKEFDKIRARMAKHGIDVRAKKIAPVKEAYIKRKYP